ncbi:hypothetical protein NN561_017192 [Cricetulus griseus]
MPGKLEMGSVSFEDVAVDFTWREWQELDASQRTLYRDVMLETYSSLVFVGHCTTKPELIFKLEQGFGPWSKAEASVWNVRGVKKACVPIETIQENEERHCCEVKTTSSSISNEEVAEAQLKVQWKIQQGAKSNSCVETYCQRPQHKKRHTCGKHCEYRDCCGAVHDKSTLTEHQRTETKEKTYECKQCRKGFYHKSHLFRHQRTHTGEKPYGCEECPKAFYHKCHLIQHQRTHTGEKPYGCEECKKTFRRKWLLTLHQRTHTGEKPYGCKECKKAFFYKSHLTRHQRTHTGEKPYECDECKKAFWQKSNLTAHKRIHTGEKPYECKVCMNAFYNKSNLTLHQRTHTGEKPYQCKECLKAFYSKSKLSRHQATHADCSHDIDSFAEDTNQLGDFMLKMLSVPVLEAEKKPQLQSALSLMTAVCYSKMMPNF